MFIEEASALICGSLIFLFFVMLFFGLTGAVVVIALAAALGLMVGFVLLMAATVAWIDERSGGNYKRIYWTFWGSIVLWSLGYNTVHSWHDTHVPTEQVAPLVAHKQPPHAPQ